MEINIAKAFSPVPLGRLRKHGKKTGEEFREDILYPSIARAMGSGDIVVVTLDGMKGFTTAFLEEAFGGLVRVKGLTLAQIDEVLKIEATEKHLSFYIEDIQEYIRDAAEKAASA
ncbi:MAG: STAS-like domain-containing protein [Gammaproteobacteria bacterium]